MEIKTGYLYHIKDEYFDIVNDENLMQNHEMGKKRPTYFTIKDKSIKDFNVELSAEKGILTLSTCGNNNKNRVILHAIKEN